MNNNEVTKVPIRNINPDPLEPHPRSLSGCLTTENNFPSAVLYTRIDIIKDAAPHMAPIIPVRWIFGMFRYGVAQQLTGGRSQIVTSFGRGCLRRLDTQDGCLSVCLPK
jgi:hypothetical protein